MRAGKIRIDLNVMLLDATSVRRPIDAPTTAKEYFVIRSLFYLFRDCTRFGHFPVSVVARRCLVIRLIARKVFVGRHVRVI